MGRGGCWPRGGKGDGGGDRLVGAVGGVGGGGGEPGNGAATESKTK